MKSLIRWKESNAWNWKGLKKNLYQKYCSDHSLETLINYQNQDFSSDCHMLICVAGHSSIKKQLEDLLIITLGVMETDDLNAELQQMLTSMVCLWIYFNDNNKVNLLKWWKYPFSTNINHAGVKKYMSLWMRENTCTGMWNIIIDWFLNITVVCIVGSKKLHHILFIFQNFLSLCLLWNSLFNVVFNINLLKSCGGVLYII